MVERLGKAVREVDVQKSLVIQESSGRTDYVILHIIRLLA